MWTSMKMISIKASRDVQHRFYLPFSYSYLVIRASESKNYFPMWGNRRLFELMLNFVVLFWTSAKPQGFEIGRPNFVGGETSPKFKPALSRCEAFNKLHDRENSHTRCTCKRAWGTVLTFNRSSHFINSFAIRWCSPSNEHWIFREMRNIKIWYCTTRGGKTVDIK